MSTRKPLSDAREAWAGDFAALRATTTEDLPPVAQTERFVLASTIHPTTSAKRNSLMSLIRRKPLLAAAVLVLAMVVLLPASYALVDHLFLSFDPSESEQEIEDDLRTQLESAGVDDAEVEVEKSGDSTRVRIQALVEEGEDIDVEPRHVDLDPSSLRIGISVECESADVDLAGLESLVSDDAFTNLAADGSAEDLEAYLADRGYDAAVTVGEGRVDVAILGVLH